MTERQRLNLRRGQLFVELLLGDLKPDLVARASETDDAEHVYLVGFTNARGGTNLYVVEYKATDRPVPARYPVSRAARDRWSGSNVPVLFLAVDTARNRVLYAVPGDQLGPGRTGKSAARASISLSLVTDEVKRSLRRRLVEGNREMAAVA